MTMHIPLIQRLAPIVVALILAGCASGVQRMDAPAGANPTLGAAAPKVAPGPLKSVSISLTPEAQKLMADNAKFNAETLRATVDRVLAAQGLMKADASQTMDIELTSFRVRSSFSAVMFGFMAGTDNVEGIVTIKDATGAMLKRAKVSASYALGGIGGGQDEARMNWLYEEFAKHAASEVTGQPSK
jgi:hypothetical protein